MIGTPVILSRLDSRGKTARRFVSSDLDLTMRDR